MKRYRFRLEQVLRVRRIEVERARAELAVANRALAEAEAELELRIETYASLPPKAQMLATELFLLDRARRERLAGAVVTAGGRQVLAGDVVEARRQEWSATAQRVAALERLDDRRRDEHDILAGRTEANILDDIAIARSVRQRAAAAKGAGR
jgi:flagellar FliJ protein